MSEPKNVCPFALRTAGEYSLLEETSGKEHKQEIWLRKCQAQYTPVVWTQKRAAFRPQWKGRYKYSNGTRRPGRTLHLPQRRLLRVSLFREYPRCAGYQNCLAGLLTFQQNAQSPARKHCVYSRLR